MASHNDLGEKGERIAIDYFIKKGYTILEKNWRFKKAEIDFIAQCKDYIIAVEVKGRSSDFFGNPQDFVTPKKIKLLVEAMNQYVVSKNISKEVRFDIVAIKFLKEKHTLEHIENAFLHF